MALGLGLVALGIGRRSSKRGAFAGAPATK